MTAADVPAEVDFFALGDTPYNNLEAGLLAELLKQVDAERPAFIAHVGDIKAGSQPCTDARNRGVARLFRSQSSPMVFTPGDNEWTDCHRQAAGALDPLERLGALRRAFYSDPAVLHNTELGLVVPDPASPENAYFDLDAVFFVLVHVVGSNNAWRLDSAGARSAFDARANANERLLDAAAGAAQNARAGAMVILFHANPLFEHAGRKPGYNRFMRNLAGLATRFDGPILLIHGDTHSYRFDRPLRDPASGAAFDRVQRVEVPGSPTVAGVWVSVDAQTQEVFRVRLLYPNASGAWLGE